MMTIRPCREEEVLLLQKICIETFLETYAHLNTKENVELYLAEAYSEEALLSDLRQEESSTYLVFCDDLPAGCLKLNYGSAQTESDYPDSLEIQRIYLLKAVQGKGYGNKLLSFAEEEGRKHGLSYLWCGVWEKNTPAVEFYQHKGFTRFSEHEFIVGTEHQTDWLMKKEL